MMRRELFYDSLLLMASKISKRRFWVHDTLLKRKELGEFHRLIFELQSDNERLKKYFRLTKRQFDEVLRS